ncbi:MULTISPECIES: DUF4262 domain-containing protein [unclassified Variovorax]|uniref:DUF4262 domain-containing protein n=1 Tax=unclassified Variovorax TaxID=663243 RepID=UPI00076CFCCE|nr:MULTISPECIES: DUF4262 domain-containing protein [unclassified Variovorax]KWT98053.1 hypothetical protein APY03_0724 [Variovorax sp. WDL1]VTU43453.1 hypothetical protein E5P1_00523 [Variovorax sp. PBL-E5]
MPEEIKNIPDFLDPHAEELIARAGWMVQGVFPTEEHPGPFFSYTIGLHQRGLSELIVMGLPLEYGHQLLNDIARWQQEEPVDATRQIGKHTLGRWPMPFHLVPVAPEQVSDMVGRAIHRSRGQASFSQVALPDRKGHFPWEPECEEGWKQHQHIRRAVH